jgi:translation initiation factor 2 beta subunit (eIF-2beta)/eIF-5
MSIENTDIKSEIPEICEKIALTNLPKIALLDEGLVKTLEGKIDGVISIDYNQSALMIVRSSSSPIPEEMKDFLEFYVRMNPDCEILFY